MILFKNVQRVTMVVFHANSAENCSDGSCRASLFPDHFPHVRRGDPEPQHGALVPFDRLNFDGLRNIH